MKVLFAQEFGGGFGHLGRLLDIAAALPEMVPVFAVPAASLSPPMIRQRLGTRFEARAAPILAVAPDVGERDGVDRNLADALQRIGYDNIVAIQAQADAWEALVEDVRPDLIVGDYAPSLQIIARKAPLLVTGNWFTIPPAGRPLPSLRHWEPYVAAPSRARERTMLAVANAVRRKRGLPGFDFFADLFHGERTYPVCHAGFDSYAKFRDVPPLQPFNVADVRPGPAFSARRGAAIFCYLNADMAGIDPLLTALNGIDAPIEIYARGVDPHKLASQAGPQVQVHERPADFTKVLPQARLFINYGAGASAYGGLLAGTPQFMAWTNLEQEANAYGVQMAGCGLSAEVAAHASAEELRAIIAPMLFRSDLQANALVTAHEMAKTRDAGMQRVIAKACRELVEGAEKTAR